MLGDDTLENHFKTNFTLAHHHGFSFAELDGMIPGERSIYIELLKQHLKDEEQRRKDEAAQLRAKNNAW